MIRHKLLLFKLIQYIREFFTSQNFLDVLPPIAVDNPGYEPHIHPYQLYSTLKQEVTNQYLHTSPEFYMKELLSEGAKKIFTINYCFRDEPSSPIHRNQFLMLEWYRASEDYQEIMLDLEKLFAYCSTRLLEDNLIKEQQNTKFIKKSVDECFQEYCHYSILDYLEPSKLRSKIKEAHPEISLPPADQCAWDDYFFLIFLNIIEPKLALKDGVILYEYPAPLSALSELSKEDPRVCKRFEIYFKGIEIANCFQELTDLREQKSRFFIDSEKKKKLYNYQLKAPEVLFNALEKGIPQSAGIALGVERFLLALTQEKEIFYTKELNTL